MTPPPPQDDILASDEHQARLTEQLQPVYSALLNVMVQKSMMPRDAGEYGPDEAEAFRRYRQDILDFYVSREGWVRAGGVRLGY